MENCCKNSYQVCIPVVGCCEYFFIDVPPGYEANEITLMIRKGGYMHFTLLLEVEDGMVSLPLDEMGNFLNPYGGPYMFMYLDPVTKDVIEFVIDGQTYDSVQFNMAPGTGDEVCSLDIFG